MYYNIGTNSAARWGVSMSLVRYKNKKTGWISVYESTSNYDPINKTSRPIRKYIGYEDPVTGEFVPSSGKPGRKKKADDNPAISGPKQSSTNEEYKRAVSEISKQREEIQDLKKQIAALNKQLEDVHKAADRFMAVVQKTR